GPSLPWRDIEAKYEYYCQVMLLLFKPWKSPFDLHTQDETWKEAFDKWKPNLKPYHASIIENMQRLHECKDSHDE
ncbi:hypothetical protein BS47DRAFT_1267723, partial [Hydnum rufescens UP504]